MRNPKAGVPADPGQLLVIGFEGVEMTPRLASLLAEVQPGGVILFARNIKSAAQTWRLLRDCQRQVSEPLFTCVDLEGGGVDRLRGVLGASPAAAEVFATGDRRLFRRHGKILGENCRALGFNVNFAPVLDLALAASREVMGSRVVSADPGDTVAYGGEFLQGLRAAGVLGCGKHFPGLGEGRLDSHHALPVIEKSFAKLWAEDLLPYRRLRARLPLVMISHAAFPQVTKKPVPASLSKRWIGDILRDRIGYRNLIVSDDLEMGGVRAAAPIERAAVDFVGAGGDLCLVCHRADYILQARDALRRAAAGDNKIAARVGEALRRVRAFKKKTPAMARRSKPPTAASMATLSRRLWEFSEEVRLEILSRAGVVHLHEARETQGERVTGKPSRRPRAKSRAQERNQ